MSTEYNPQQYQLNPNQTDYTTDPPWADLDYFLRRLCPRRAHPRTGGCRIRLIGDRGQEANALFRRRRFGRAVPKAVFR